VGIPIPLWQTSECSTPPIWGNYKTNNTTMIKILLIEKNLIFSSTLTDLLSKDEELDVVGICTKGNDVLDFLNNHPVDVIIMDNLQINGLVTTAQVAKEFPKVKIIGFSTYQDGDFKTRMVELGASCYLSKYDTTLNKLIAEIKK
jgi:DNA-binding NarL/FixJ family response regulator